jgi:hypothetical protein
MNSTEENNNITVISDQISIFRGEACSTRETQWITGSRDKYYLDAFVKRTIDSVPAA